MSSDEEYPDPSVALTALMHGKQQRDAENPLYLQHPLEYEWWAIEWCKRDAWTETEAANLLAGCVPIRPFPLYGAIHQQVNAEVQSTA